MEGTKAWTMMRIVHAFFAYIGLLTRRKAGKWMQNIGQNQKELYRIYMNLFCVGLILGVFLLNVGRKIFLDYAGVLDEYTLYNMKNMVVDHNDLFWYVLQKRMLVVLFLLIVSTTYLGLVVCRGVIIWFGCSAGVFLAALAVRYGIKGVVLAIVSVFPHYLLYIPVFCVLLGWCEILFRAMNLHSGEIVWKDKKTAMAKVGKIFPMIIAMAVACLLESYVNPYLLLGFLKTF